MAKRDILKEAIADAKAVKEVAIANAKAALEEAFTPKLKSMLAAKIAEMDENEGSPVNEYDADFVEFCKKNPQDPTCPGSPWNEGKEEQASEPLEPNSDEELDLDEILAELEQDTLNEAEEVEAEEEVEVEDETETEEEGVELEDMTDEDLKLFIEDVIADMIAAGELEAGESVETEEDEEIDIEVVDDEEVEVEDSEEVEVAEANKSIGDIIRLTTESKKYRRAIRKSKYELKEAYATIKSLRSSLNEVNLLNAKLLYTNKIFKAKSLTENEKIKVLGAFDKATTVKETKLVFSTLSEGLNNKKKQIRESLGSASKSTGNFTKNKKPIIEANPMVERFQKLAGLK